MRDWPIPRISWSSATESSSCSRRRRRRRRVGSAMRRRKLIVDGIDKRNDISTYHDWSICLEGRNVKALNRSSVCPTFPPLLRFIASTNHVYYHASPYLLFR